MGVCIEKIAHQSDKCNSRDGLQVFQKDDGSYDGYCFSCGTYVADPYHDKPKNYKPQRLIKSKEQILKEIEDVTNYPVVDLVDRNLKSRSLDYFDIRIGLDESDGVTPVLHYYPYRLDGELCAYKVRLIENKRIWSIGDQSNVDFFGWEQAKAAGGKKLFITEGECDAVAFYQICKDVNKGTQYAEHSPAVISLPHGAASAGRDMAKFSKKIREHFKEIVLVFDQDEAGKKAVEDVLRVMPECLVATLPFKDVNEGLIQGRGKRVYEAVMFNAKKPKNTRFVSGCELHASAKEPAQYGVSWPWKHITKATRGIRLGETIYIGAGQKQG